MKIWILILAVLGTASQATEVSDPQDALLEAAQQGAMEKIQELMQAGADPHACSKYGESAFGRAARAGHTAAAVFMIENGGALQKGENLNCPTPLMMAAMADSTNLIARLLEAGADVNEKRMGNRTALVLAAWNGRTEAVRMLLENGADMNAAVGADNMTAVQWAIFTGKKETVELLLDLGADPGPAPLLTCLQDLEMMELLVSRGADVNARRRASISVGKFQEWESALHTAATCCQTNSILWLLEHGAPVDDPGVHDRTPLMSAIISHCTAGALLLMERGADVNAADRLDMTPLIYAARGQDSKIIQNLLDRGADINAKGKSGKTALDTAMDWKNHFTAGMLIKAGAEVGPDLLLRAAVESNAALDEGNLMQSILDRGIKVDSPNALGQTALMLAAQANHAANVQWLLSKGADVTLKDASEKTAGDYTQAAEILNILRQTHEIAPAQ